MSMDLPFGRALRRRGRRVDSGANFGGDGGLAGERPPLGLGNVPRAALADPNEEPRAVKGSPVSHTLADLGNREIGSIGSRGNKTAERRSGAAKRRALRKGDPMNNHRLPLVLALTLVVLALAVTAGAYPAGEATASIQILSPDNHAVLDAGESYALEYAITLGPKDDHFHVWVDGERSPGIHDLKGSYRLP